MKIEIDKTRFNKLMLIIPTGADNAISQNALADALDLTPRYVRQLVLTARIDGNFICGDDSGYYLPADSEELYRWYLRARSRNKTGWASIAPARRLLKEEGFDLD